MKKLSLSALGLVLATTAHAAPSKDAYKELTNDCAPFLTIATLDEDKKIDASGVSVTRTAFSKLSAEEMQHAIDTCKPSFNKLINGYYKDFPTSAGHLNAGFQAAQSIYVAQITKETADLAQMAQERATKTTQATTASVMASNAKLRADKIAETNAFIEQMSDTLKTAQLEAAAKDATLGAIFTTLNGMNKAHAGVGSDLNSLADASGSQQLELGFDGDL